MWVVALVTETQHDGYEAGESSLGVVSYCVTLPNLVFATLGQYGRLKFSNALSGVPSE